MAKKKKEKIIAFRCSACEVTRHHSDFTTCEVIQEHIRLFSPRKRDAETEGTCNGCYTKAMRDSLPGKGLWTAIKAFFGFGSKA